MVKEIIIRNYDLKAQRRMGDLSQVLGVAIGDTQYAIFYDDYIFSSRILRGKVVVPRTAYKVIGYNERTCTVRAREVTDLPLLEKIAIEFEKSISDAELEE